MIMKTIQMLLLRCALALASGLSCTSLAWADGDSSSHADSSVTTRASLSGPEVYRQYCMACHMADGEGAQGAGYFPALARNGNLAAAGYPIYVILNGLGGMPWFNGLLQDEEIAAVVHYIRSSFGNHYTDAPNADDVAIMRGPVPQE